MVSELLYIIIIVNLFVKSIIVQLVFDVYRNSIGICKMDTSVYLFFVCFVALRPKSTAMVIAGRSVHLTTLFPGQA